MLLLTSTTRILHLFGLALGFAFASHATTARADGNLLVIGVIASADPQSSVTLLKSRSGGTTFAVRVGQEVERGTFIRRVTRDYVYFESKGRLEKVRVGEELGDGAFATPADRSLSVAAEKGMERRGNVVRVSAALRDHIVKRDLNKVLMQAAAVPYYEQGALRGFRLWEIDPGSVIEMSGFQNGDIITAVNGQLLTDVSLTVRMLQSLRNEPRADVTLTRQGIEQTIQIVVE